MKPSIEYSYLPKTKDLLSRSVFWVYQNKTYYSEKAGGFLWSPKYTRDGRRHPGYETMKEVRPGDIIIHSYKSEIVTISIAKTACFSCDRPSVAFAEWDADGWKIECEYFELPLEFSIDSICRKLYELQPVNGPFVSAGTGKQQYLCNANKRMLDCILTAYASSAYRKIKADKLLDFLQLEENAVALSDNTKNDNELFQEVHIQKNDENCIVDGCKVAAIILNTGKNTALTIDTNKYPKQKPLLGKTVGEVFQIEGIDLKYQITKIWTETEK